MHMLISHDSEIRGLRSDMFLPTLQNVTFWRATRCFLLKIAQKIQEKAKNHQYLTKNVHVW